MGRRRERWQGGSRKLKLDLSEDSQQDAPGNDASNGNAKLLQSETTGLQGNSLQLLGQYNGGEESSPKAGNRRQAADMDAQVKDFMADLKTNGLLDSETEQEKNKDSGGTSTSKQHKLVENVVPIETTKTVHREEKSKWKAIYDDKSQDYYYWNVETGATTWDKPDSYAPEESADPIEAPACGTQSQAETATPETNSVLGIGSGEMQVAAKSELQAAANSPMQVAANSETQIAANSEARIAAASIEAQAASRSDVPDADFCLSAPAAAAQPVEADPYMHMTDVSALLQLGENITNRLKLLTGDALSALPLKVRLCIEAEQRLLDCKLLAMHGSSDTILWSYMEAEFRKMEPMLVSEEEIQQRLAAVEAHRQAQIDADMEVDMDLDEETRQPASLQAEQSQPPASAPPATAPSTTDADDDKGSGVASGVSAALKNIAKTTRLKKRNAALPTVSSSFNKKVSTLVTKWNAAKEELQERDNEAKALYDPQALEMKRQKEIEHWRREQIASGQASDNVNFQPLGAFDWRERVKRAKAKQMPAS